MTARVLRGRPWLREPEGADKVSLFYAIYNLAMAMGVEVPAPPPEPWKTRLARIVTEEPSVLTDMFGVELKLVFPGEPKNHPDMSAYPSIWCYDGSSGPRWATVTRESPARPGVAGDELSYSIVNFDPSSRSRRTRTRVRQWVPSSDLKGRQLVGLARLRGGAA